MNSTVFVLLGTTNVPVVKHENLCVLRARKPLSSVAAQQHLGNSLVHGEVQPGWHSQAASSTELSAKTAGGGEHEMPVGACGPVSVE